MRLLRDESWTRRGCSLLWSIEAISRIVNLTDVVSMREFFLMKDAWPEDLPALNNKALVVMGLDACLDALSYEDIETWIYKDLNPCIYSFQEHYEGQAALIFWLPNGNRRIEMLKASDNYIWHCAAPNSNQTIPIGLFLWAGAENDAARIISPNAKNPDPDGSDWIGLYHPRIS